MEATHGLRINPRTGAPRCGVLTCYAPIQPGCIYCPGHVLENIAAGGDMSPTTGRAFARVRCVCGAPLTDRGLCTDRACAMFDGPEEAEASSEIGGTSGAQ